VKPGETFKNSFARGSKEKTNMATTVSEMTIEEFKGVPKK